jgi:hypothetical protein
MTTCNTAIAYQLATPPIRYLRGVTRIRFRFRFRGGNRVLPLQALTSIIKEG